MRRIINPKTGKDKYNILRFESKEKNNKTIAENVKSEAAFFVCFS